MKFFWSSLSWKKRSLCLLRLLSNMILNFAKKLYSQVLGFWSIKTLMRRSKKLYKIFLDFFLLHNCGVFRWSLPGGNQKCSYGENWTGSRKWFINSSSFWKLPNTGNLVQGIKREVLLATFALFSQKLPFKSSWEKWKNSSHVEERIWISR